MVANINGNTATRWILGILLALLISWLGALTSISYTHTPMEYTMAADDHTKMMMMDGENRVTTRLDRIEDKLDRLIERD